MTEIERNLSKISSQKFETVLNKQNLERSISMQLNDAVIDNTPIINNTLAPKNTYPSSDASFIGDPKILNNQIFNDSTPRKVSLSGEAIKSIEDPIIFNTQIFNNSNAASTSLSEKDYGNIEDPAITSTQIFNNSDAASTSLSGGDYGNIEDPVITNTQIFNDKDVMYSRPVGTRISKIADPKISNTKISNKAVALKDKKWAKTEYGGVEDLEISGTAIPNSTTVEKRPAFLDVPTINIDALEISGTAISNSTTVEKRPDFLVAPTVDIDAPAISNTSASGQLSLRNDFLPTLISDSSDAFSNLFDVAIVFDNSGKVIIPKCRILNFTAPKREVSTEEIPFMNISVKKIVASSNIDHQQIYNIRVDDNYAAWTDLKAKMGGINSYGDFNIYEYDKPENIAEITVTAYKFNFNPVPQQVRQWVFHNCQIVNIVDYTYNYGSSQGVSGNIIFTYTHFDENSLLSS